MSLKTIIEFIKLVMLLWDYANDAVEYAVIKKKMHDFKKLVKKATTGTLEERMEGGKEIEDIFNSRTKSDD